MAKATYLLKKAGELVKDRRYQEAVEVYLQATETDSSDARAWFGLGVCLYKVDNLDVSRIALERALKMGYPRAQEALLRVDEAERRRSAEGKGAKPTVAPADVRQRVTARSPAKEPPPRPASRPDEDKIALDRFLRIMLIENIESDRAAIIQAIEGSLRDVEVKAVDYGVSTSDTMSGTVHYDVAVLDWDAGPDAAAGLIQILKIKRPTLLVICLTERWDPESAVEILEAGADYHLVKEPHFASAIPLVLTQWTRRERAVILAAEARAATGGSAGPEVLNAFGEAVMLVDADLSVLQANPAAMKQFRRGDDETVGRPYCRLLYNEDEPPYSCPIADALERGRPADSEVVHKATNTPLRVKAWPVRNAVGKVTSAIVLLRPAQASEAASENLRAREWLYRTLTERANAGVVMVGPDGTIQYANPKLCALSDQTEEELQARPVESLVPAEHQEGLRRCLAAAVDRGEAAERIAVQKSNGDSVPADLRVARFAGQDGNCLVLTILGATEQEQAERELWAEARKVAALLDEGIDRLEGAVAVLDGQGRITWANATAAHLLGCSKEDLLGSNYLEVARKGLADAVEDPEEFIDTLASVFETGVPLENRRLALRDGNGALSYWSTLVESRSPAVCRVEQAYPAPPAPAGAPAAADASAAASDRLSQLAAILPEMVFCTDRNGTIRWCNPAAPQVCGYAPERLMGMALSDLAADSARKALSKLLQKACRTPAAVQTADLEMAREDGGRYWGEVTLIAVDGGGEADDAVVQGFLRDTTGQRIADAVRRIVQGEPAG